MQNLVPNRDFIIRNIDMGKIHLQVNSAGCSNQNMSQNGLKLSRILQRTTTTDFKVMFYHLESFFGLWSITQAVAINYKEVPNELNYVSPNRHIYKDVSITILYMVWMYILCMIWYGMYGCHIYKDVIIYFRIIVAMTFILTWQSD